MLISFGSRRGYRPQQQGFTLLEIMIVVAILGILAAMVAPNIMGRPDQARTVKAQQDVLQIGGALDLYRLDNHRYPTQEQGLQALMEAPYSEPLPVNYSPNGYLRTLPEDPWGQPYQYLNPGVRGPIDIFSWGANGLEGGEGIDAEIGNWQ